MRRFLSLLERFRSDERGAFLALFGILAIVIIALSGAVVDYTSVEQARTRAQVALDAAALALQPKVYEGTSEAELQDDAEQLLINRIADSRITADVTDAIKDTDAGTLTLKASLTVPMYFVQLIGIDTMSVKLQSQSTRGSMNVEVAVALDTTGSMSGTKISDLRTATSTLIDLVVQDVQTPTYTKMALVPYSMGVNVGSYADSFRGPVTRPAITGAAYLTTASTTISSISKANPGVVTTSVDHNLSTGAFIYITNVSGTNYTALNNNYYRVVRISATQFSLQSCDTSGNNCSNVNTNSWGNNNYVANSGRFRSCLTTSCEVVITSPSHPFAANEYTYITGVGGMTQLNGQAFSVGSTVTTNTFVLSGTNSRATTYSAYTSGGTADCLRFSCQYYTFTNAWGGTNTFSQSTCVTERVGAHQYDDAAPSTTYVGRNYPSSGNPCLSNQIVPLTSSKTTLHATASSLVAAGSTAGQIGLAWAWYMISPTFLSGVPGWPTASQPAAYNTPNLLKVVVLMTDGDFNSVYYNGVIAKDSLSGSGSSADHINQNSSNGDPYAQAQNQCDAMKAAGIIVYTVGFDIASQPNAQAIMADCATDAAHAYLADSGTDLQEAFEDIGQHIQALRISE